MAHFYWLLLFERLYGRRNRGFFSPPKILGTAADETRDSTDVIHERPRSPLPGSDSFFTRHHGAKDSENVVITVGRGPPIPKTLSSLEECFRTWNCGIKILFFSPLLKQGKTTTFFERFLCREIETSQGESIDRQNVEKGGDSPPKRQQDSETTRNKMRCSQGVAMIFEDAFVVFSRFLALRSRGCALLETHRQRETTGIKKLYNSFFVMF
ncbi:uncharacterized protein LOC114941729 [Nylanderia fulva]|uniref:uncharacterized protein LOC114941729 n=1 Tax=Nylanderia fulva TaxID=613905 RepID=UPI0010FBAD3A|nr:uncharacterized protein LOC114941729 [Nylanderia fulva]